jgi:hypothetical protein
LVYAKDFFLSDRNSFIISGVLFFCISNKGARMLKMPYPEERRGIGFVERPYPKPKDT